MALAACTRMPPPPRPYLAFVANQGSNTVAAVNLASFAVTASIPVAAEPLRLAARPGARELYVLSGTGSLSVIDPSRMLVAASIPIGRGGNTLAITSDGKMAAAGDGAAGEIALVDCASRTVAGRLRPGGDISAIAFTPDGKTLMAADRARDRLAFFDTATRKPLGEVKLGKAPGALAILPDGGKVFVADTGEPRISAVDVSSRQLLSNLEIGSNPGQLVIKPDGGELFALSPGSATLTIVDAFHDDVEEEIPAGQGAVAAVITRDGARLFVLNAGAAGTGGSVEAVDLENRSLPSSTVSTAVGGTPAALALTPDERYLVVADPGTSSVAVLETSPMNPKAKKPGSPLPLITVIPAGSRPVDVVVPDWLER